MAIVGYACEDVKAGDSVAVSSCCDDVNGNDVITCSLGSKCCSVETPKPKTKPHGEIVENHFVTGNLMSGSLPISQGAFDFYDYNFSNAWGTDYSKLNKKLLDSGGKLDKELKKIQFKMKHKPHGTIEDKPTNLASQIPVPNLLISDELIQEAKVELESRKFKPLVRVDEGDVVWNYNDNFQGKGKITSINYVQDYEHARKITIEAILTE